MLATLSPYLHSIHKNMATSEVNKSFLFPVGHPVTLLLTRSVFDLHKGNSKFQLYFTTDRGSNFGLKFFGVILTLNVTIWDVLFLIQIHQYLGYPIKHPWKHYLKISLKIKCVKRTYRLFGKYYRVAMPTKLYLTFSGIIMLSFKYLIHF